MVFDLGRKQRSVHITYRIHYKEMNKLGENSILIGASFNGTFIVLVSMRNKAEKYYALRENHCSRDYNSWPRRFF
jgi:hypothetical protein